MPSVNVLGYGSYGAVTSGVNANETTLTPANVTVSDFGKLYTTQFDGEVLAQPLVDNGIMINAGPNTTAESAGLHDVIFVVTENDSIFALDADNNGAILWHRSLLDTSATGTIPGTNIDNPLGASSITAVPSPALDTGDIYPEVGITGTPVIDPSTGIMYLVAKTEEIVGTTTYFVQRLHAINTADGTDVTAPYEIGDTTGYNPTAPSYTPGNINTTQIYVYGDGVGNVPDPYPDGQPAGTTVVQFNAQTENNRSGLSLVNGVLYIAWASHSDNDPYHGWLAAWNVNDIETTGFSLTGVFCTSPNDAEAGIWMGGGTLQFEPDGSAFYFMTGNGNGVPSYNPDGTPAGGFYDEALVKAVLDPTTTQANMNENGWGIQAVSFFTPYDVNYLDQADSDFGSGAPSLLPPSAGIPGHPNLIVAVGKSGQVYVLDRDALPGYSAAGDNALDSVPNGAGIETAPQVVAGCLSTPSYYNGRLYVQSAYSGPAVAFTINPNGTLQATSSTTEEFGYAPGSVTISSNGGGEGIVWLEDRIGNQVHAYSTNSLNDELWNSGQAPANADAAGPVTKFIPAVVANGQVISTAYSSITVYGLRPSPATVPDAPSLYSSSLSGTSLSLSWSDPTTAPNTPTIYSVEESTDGINFIPVTTVPAPATTVSIGALAPSTTYTFRIRGLNSLGYSDYSNPVPVTTADQVPTIDYSGGFANDPGLILNGSAAVNGSDLQLTPDSPNQDSSVFYQNPVDVTEFNTQFTFQFSSGADTGNGFAFVIQTAGPTALGAGGYSLGYGPGTGGNNLPSPFTQSLAVKFDLATYGAFDNSTTGFFTDGANPSTSYNQPPSEWTDPSGIDFHSSDIFNATISYNGLQISLTIEDTDSSATYQYAENIDLPSVLGSNSAYVGFTAGTSSRTAQQDISNWQLTSLVGFSPLAPSALGAVVSSATSINLNWTTNSVNQIGFHLDRATDPGFTQNLITEVLPQSLTNYTDTVAGLQPGTTYYYRIRAYNEVGDSSNSNIVQVTIPLAPPRATDQMVTNVTSDEIDLSWQDNAGHLADGYQIIRSENNGDFIQVATLPPTSRTAPSIYTWSDFNVTPGNFYEYHIIAYNVSGHNDFAGLNATTLCNPPTDVTATPGNNRVVLTWNASTGAVSYNVYRGTATGDETLYASNITGTDFVDTDVTNGVTYFYTVTAVNNNLAPIPAEGSPSAEVSTNPTAYSWAVTGSGTYDWNTPANWISSGPPNDPTHPGDVADITDTGTGPQVISLSAPATVGLLNLGDSTGATSFTVTSKSGIPLTFDSGSPSPANLTLLTTPTTTETISAPVSLASNLLVTTAGSGVGSITGNISGVGTKSLTIDGTGTLALSGNNTYSGGTTLAGGNLEASSPSALGTGPLLFTGGTLAFGSNPTTPVGNPIPISATNTAFFNASPSVTGTVTGAITGSGGFETTGPGTVVLAGDNTYSGPTVVSDGTLAAGSTTGLSPDSSFEIATGSVLSLNGFTSLPLSVSGTGTIEDGSALPGTLTVLTGATPAEFDGVLANGGSGSLGLDLAGTGSLLLTGTETYTGPTRIPSGTLVVSGSETSSPITIAGGTLAGTGTVGAVTVSAGGTLEAGSAAGTGILTVGNLAFSPATSGWGSLTASLNGGTPGTGYDQIIAGGPLNLNNGTLNLIPGTGLTPGASYTLISNPAGYPITGIFRGLNEGGVIDAGGDGFLITYQGGLSGHDVVVTDIGPVDTYYVNAAWAGDTPGQDIPDADPVAPGNQDATIGTTAFATIGAAVAAALPYSTIIVNGGTYDESVTLPSSYLITFQAGPVSLQQLNDPIGTSTITVDGVALTLGQDQSTPSTILSPIVGTGTLVLAGSESLTLGGTDLYSGGTVVDGGELVLGSDFGIPEASNVTVAPGGTLALNGFNLGLATISGTGSVINGSTTAATLTVGQGDVNSTTGVTFADGGLAPLSIVKTGAGNWTIGSAASTFTGGTTIATGNLAFSAPNPDPLGIGPVTIQSGGTLDAAAQSVSLSSLVLAGGTAIGTGGGTISLSASEAVLIDGVYTSAAPAVSVGLTLTGADGGTIFDSAPATPTGTAVFSGPIDVGPVGLTVVVQGTSPDVVGLLLTGVVSGTGTLTQSNIAGNFPDWGTFELTNPENSYSGGTTLASGRLVLTDAGTVGTGPITIGAAGSIALASTTPTTFSNSLLIDRTGNLGDNYDFDISNLSGSNTWSGPVSLVDGGIAEVAVATGTQLTISGSITSDGTDGGLMNESNASPSLVGSATSSTGTLVLSGANTYTGPTVVREETLVAGSTGAIPTQSALVVSAGTKFVLNGFSVSIGSLSGGGVVTNSSPTPATLTTGGLNTNSTFTGLLTDGLGGGSLSLVQAGSGTLTLSGTGVYSGGTTLDAGAIYLANPTVLGTGPIVLAGGSIAATGTPPPGSGLIQGSIRGPYLDTTSPNPGGSTTPGFVQGEQNQYWYGDQTYVYSGEFYTADGSVAFAEDVDDAAQVSIDGIVYLLNTTPGLPATTGRLYLSPGWHSIDVRFWQGTGPAGPVTGSGWYAGNPGYGFGMATDAQGNWADIPLSTGAGTGITSPTPMGTDYFDPVDTGSGTLLRTSGFDLSNPIVLANSASSIHVLGNVFTTLTIGGSISGSAALNITGPGNLRLAGTNTYTGPTEISVPKVAVGSASALGVGSVVDLAQGSGLATSGEHLTIGGLSGAGYVVNDSASQGTLVFGTANATTTFDGGWSDGPNSAPLNVTEVGSGTLNFQGIIQGINGISTVSGTIAVTGGNLIMDGPALIVGNGNLVVSGTGVLSGPGQALVPTSVVGGGKIAPGGTGTNFIATGPLNLSPGGVYSVNLNGTTPGSGYDQLIAHGPVSINGAVLHATIGGGYLPAPGDSLDLIQNLSGSPVIGTFAGLPEGGLVTIDGDQFQITYAGGTSGHDVVLTQVVPATIYVDSAWAGDVQGQDIADADPVAPGAQDATFGVTAFATIADALANVTTFGSIIVNSGTYAEAVDLTQPDISVTFQGGPVTLDSLASSSPTASIILSVDGSAAESPITLTVGGDDTDTTLESPISGPGGLVKTGTGTMTLASSNVYSGLTEVAGGTLLAGSVSAFGLNSAVTVDSGAVLDLNGFEQILGSISGSGTIENGSTTGTTLTTGADGTSTTFAGLLEDGSSPLVLNKVGRGTLSLTGAANAFSGGTWITAGNLTAASAAALGTGNLTLNGGGFTDSATSDSFADSISVMAAGGTLITPTSASTLTLTGGISGTGELIKSGGGQLIVTGFNTLTGPMVIQSGSVQIGTGTSVAEIGTGTVTTDSGATLSLDEPGPLSSPTPFANPLTGSGTLLIEGTASAGAVLLTGSNAGFTGQVVVSGGQLSFAGGSSLGNFSAVTVTGGQFDFGPVNNRTLAAPLTLTGDGVTDPVDGATGALLFTGTGDTWSGPVRVVGSARIAAPGMSGIISGPISGGNLTFGVSGLSPVPPTSIVLTGSNSYGSTTVAANATLLIGNGGPSGSLGQGNVTLSGTLGFDRTGTTTLTSNLISTSGGDLSVEGNGTLALAAGAVVSVGEINVGNSLAGSPSNGSLSIAAGATLTDSGPFLVGSSGSTGAVTQIGGTVTLTSASGVGPASNLDIGYGGGSGVYTLSGGLFTVPGGEDITVGEGGTGVFTQTGGNATVAGFRLGSGPGATGSLSLATGTLTVGAAGFYSTGGVGRVTLASGTLIAATNFTDSLPTSLTGTVVINTGANAVAFTGVLSGAGGIQQVGPGSLSLYGSNSYSGGTTVASGNLNVYASTALGLGPVTLAGGSLTASGIVPGLLEGQILGNPFDLSSSNDAQAVTPNLPQGESGQLVASGGPWSSNQTWVYTGQFYTADGTVAFAENLDGPTSITIDGVTYLDSPAAAGPITTGQLTLTPGWHAIEVRFGNGTGPAGPAANGAAGWTSTYGFGMATDASPGWGDIPPGPATGTPSAGIDSPTPDGGDYFSPSDPGDGSLFRTRAPVALVIANPVAIASPASSLTVPAGASVALTGLISGSGLTKLGTGTLTLSGPNNYSGTTTLAAGVIQTNSATALGNNTAVTVATGSILALDGSNLTVGNLLGSGTVLNNGPSVATLTTGALNGYVPFGGVLQDGSSPLALVKTGTGTVIVSQQQTYTGGRRSLRGIWPLPDREASSPQIHSVSPRGHR